jgi:hypothetical protein
LLFQGSETGPVHELEIIEISQDIKHAAGLPANPARPGGDSAIAIGCLSKSKRVMIFVLRHQVKTNVAGNYGKSVAKSRQNNRNPEL